MVAKNMSPRDMSKHIECLKHKLGKYMLLNHDKEAQLTNDQYVIPFIVGGQHELTQFVLQALDIIFLMRSNVQY